MYPLDETVAGRGDEREEPLRSTIQEALSRHWHGISFRERNAGPGIDMHMKDEGFQVRVGNIFWAEPMTNPCTS